MTEQDDPNKPDFTDLRRRIEELFPAQRDYLDLLVAQARRKLLERDRAVEAFIYRRRLSAISDLIALPEMAPLFDGIPTNSSILDLLTGTGAGLGAVYAHLVKQGKQPAIMVGVDKFDNEPLSREGLNFYNQTATAITLQEAERNLEGLPARVVKQSAVSYLLSLASGGSDLSFDLVTAFSIPLHSVKEQDVVVMARVVEGFGYNTPALFTFGDISMNNVPKLQQAVSDRLPSRWKFYRKPQGTSWSGWDINLLSNRELGLKTFPQRRMFQRE